MRKSLYQSLLVAAVFFVAGSVFCPRASKGQSEKDQSEAVSESATSLKDLFTEALKQKAKDGLEALSSLLIRGVSSGAVPQRIDFKQFAAQLLNVQKYELKDIGSVDCIRISNGILILTPGEENSVRFMALPEQKKNVTCKKVSGGVQLGLANPGKKTQTAEDVVVFVASYVQGAAPKVVASGSAQVFARSINQTRPLEVVLSDSARYVVQDVTLDTLAVTLSRKSSYNLISANVKSLHITARDESQVDVMGCSVANKAAVEIKGHSFRTPSRVSLQGAAPLFEAHVAGGILDAGSFKADDVVLYPAVSAKTVQVNASKSLRMCSGQRGERNPDLVVEYVGDASVDENTSGLKLRRASAGLSIASTLGAVDGVDRAKILMQRANKVVEEGMTLFDTFSSLVRG